MRYSLIKITDWICYFSDETKKNFECKKKTKKQKGRKTAIKFSESARFLPVGRARSNKHLFIFGLYQVKTLLYIVGLKTGESSNTSMSTCDEVGHIPGHWKINKTLALLLLMEGVVATDKCCIIKDNWLPPAKVNRERD